MIDKVLLKEGFAIENEIYSEEEVKEILNYCEANGIQQKIGLRFFLKNNPELYDKILTPKLKSVLNQLGDNFKIIKSIYFDKPPTSNWIVNWHQDLTINVNQQIELEGFVNWRKLSNRFVVQPSLNILENIVTVRIHLDDCFKENGALRVIKESHRKGILDVRNGIDENMNAQIHTARQKLKRG